VAESTKKIVILGTAGNCIDILDTIHEINSAAGGTRYECIGFLDDAAEQHHTQICGVKVLGSISTAKEVADAWFVNGIGSPSSYLRKEAIIAGAGIADDRFVTLVHPTASVSRMARLGPGTVVFQNATVTSGVEVGSHVVILPNSIVSHDDKIGDFTCIAGGVCISGGVTIGKSCYLGTNCSIRDRVTIGDESLVGMGSVALADVPPNAVVAGSPARYIRPARPQ
jgi:sugar O-acyltransferase (sialic acid O-acetyltransferase NeuD family)